MNCECERELQFGQLCSKVSGRNYWIKVQRVSYFIIIWHLKETELHSLLLPPHKLELHIQVFKWHVSAGQNCIILQEEESQWCINERLYVLYHRYNSLYRSYIIYLVWGCDQVDGLHAGQRLTALDYVFYNWKAQTNNQLCSISSIRLELSL